MIASTISWIERLTVRLSRYAQRFRSYVERRRDGLFLLASVAIYSFVLSYWTVLKYLSFNATGLDLGVFNQALSTTIHGQGFFKETPDLIANPSSSFFGIHFSPLLLLIIPLYFIFPSPILLLVLQSVAIACASIPIYFISMKTLGSRLAASAYVLIYLLYAPMNWVNWFDFHPEAFFPLFVLSSFWFWISGKIRWYLLFGILALSVIEYVQVLVGSLALVQIAWAVKRRLGKQMFHASFGLLVASVAWLVLALQVIGYVNSLRVPGQWNKLGPGTFGPLVALFTRPGVFVSAFFDDWGAKTQYLWKSLAPFSFTSPFDLLVLLVFLWIIPAFLSSVPAYYSIGFQYAAFVSPFLILSSIRGLSRLRRFKIIRGRGVQYLSSITLLIVIIMWFSLSPLGPWPGNRLPQLNSHTSVLYSIIEEIPPGASVLTQNDIFPQLSSRENAYLFPDPSGEATTDYIIGDMTSRWFLYSPRSQLNPGRMVEVVNSAIQSGRYGIIAFVDGVVLLKHGFAGLPIRFEPFTSTYDYRTLTLRNGSIVQDPTSTSGEVFQHPRLGPGQASFWSGPHAMVPPGQYTLSYRLKETPINISSIATLDIFNGTSVLAITVLNGTDFSADNEWTTITRNVTLGSFQFLDFRGMNVSSSANLSLDYISVRQVSL